MSRGLPLNSMTAARSLAYNLTFYITMLGLGVILAPLAMLSRRITLVIARTWCGAMLALLRVICGVRVEVRGQPPRGDCILACKHQSFLDILILVTALESPRFVMKTELRHAPVFGWYARRLGCIPVDRSAGRTALAGMIDAIQRHRAGLGQLVIYPQGTRVAPFARVPYRIGAAAAGEATGLPCQLAATNAGLFWGRNRFLRHPGVAVVEFLGPLPAGLAAPDALAEMERRIEAASDRLLGPAGEGRGEAGRGGEESG